MNPDLPDLRDLLPDDVADDELEELGRIDGLLRATPAPPEEVPESLTAAVRRSRRGRSPATGSRSSNVMALRRRRVLALGLAAALGAVAFVAGYFVRGGGDGRGDSLEAVTLVATQNGVPESEMVVEVLAKDTAGNWPLLGQVAGLEPAPEGQYYELWLTRDKKVVLSCGRFTVDADGNASDVWLNAPYKWREYDEWVVTLENPGGKPPRSKWLLRAPIDAAAT